MTMAIDCKPAKHVRLQIHMMKRYNSILLSAHNFREHHHSYHANFTLLKVALQEVQDAREIELEINEGHSSDAVKNTWMKLEDLETAFAAYSKYTEGMVDPLRMALCGDIDRPMLDTEKVLVEEVHEVRKIEREMKEDFLPNSLDHIWMELGTLEAKFAAYSNHVEEMIDGLRKILGAEHSLG